MTGGGPSKDSTNDIKPKTASDMRLRIKHTKDSIDYNTRHAADHAKALVKAKAQLKQTKAALKKAPKGT